MYNDLSTEYYNLEKGFASKKELEFYQSIFSPSDNLLEPMCGSGRLLLPLMQLGYSIDGLDNSKAMLASCIDRASTLKLNPSLLEGTFEEHAFSHQYQGIIIPIASFQLFYPRANAHHALDILRKLLTKDGTLVIDCRIPWDVLIEHNSKNIYSSHFKLSEIETIEANYEITANKDTQQLVRKIQYIKRVNGKKIAEEKEEMHVLWYYLFEMELMLEKHGFSQIKHVRRALDGTNYLTFIAKV